MTTCGNCGGSGGGAGQGGAGGGGAGVPAPKVAGSAAYDILYIKQASIVVVHNSGPQIIFTLPPAAAVDVFIRYRNPTDGSETDTVGLTRFSIHAVQRIVSYQIDSATSDNVGDSGGRILAIRDLPVDHFEVKADGLLFDSVTAYFDVIAVGWGKEPTGLGPIALTQWTDTTAPAASGRNVGLALMGIRPNGSGDPYAVVLSASRTAEHGALSGNLGDLNVLPMTQYLATPPTRSADSLGPFLCDANGNLKVVTEGGAAAIWPAASALSDADPNPTTTRVGANALFFNGTTWDRGRSGVITAATPTGWQNGLGAGVYNSAAPTLTNGQAITLQLDVNGNLLVVQAGATALADGGANPTTTRVGADLLSFNGTTWDRVRSGGIVAATPTGWPNILSGGVYNSSAPTLTTGQAITLQLDANGYLKSREQYAPVYEDNTNGVAATIRKPAAAAAYSWLSVFNTALAKSLVIKASAGTVRSITARIDSTATTGTYYLQLWNLTAAPADTTAVSSGNSLMAPIKVQHVNGTDDYIPIDFPDPGVYGSTGLVLEMSTTEFTATLVGSNWLSATALYV